MTTVDAAHITQALAAANPGTYIVTWVAVVAVILPDGSYDSYILRPPSDPIEYHRGLLDAGLHNIRGRK